MDNKSAVVFIATYRDKVVVYLETDTGQAAWARLRDCFDEESAYRVLVGRVCPDLARHWYQDVIDSIRLARKAGGVRRVPVGVA